MCYRMCAQKDMEEHAYIVEQLGRPQNIDIVKQMEKPQTVDIVEELDESSRNKDSAIIQFYEVPFKIIVPATIIDLSEQIHQCDQVKVQSVTVPLHNTDDLTIQHDTDTEDASHANIHRNGAVQGNIGTEYTGHANINRNDAFNTQAIGIQDKTTILEDRTDLYEKSNIQGVSETTKTTDKSHHYESSNINTNTCIDFLAEDVGLKCESDVDTSSDIGINSESIDDSPTDGDVQATSCIKLESYEEMDRNHVFNEQETDIKSESDDHMNINQEEITVPVIPKSAATVTVLSKSLVIQDQTASFEDRSYKCDVCGKQFEKFSQLKEHKSIHDVDIKSEYDVDTTLTTIYSTQDISIKSNSLEDSTTDGVGIKSELYDHEMDTNHVFSEQDTDIKCESDDHMNKNQEEITGPAIPISTVTVPVLSKSPAIKDETATTEERPYKCTVCGKQFQTFQHLKEHKTIHSWEKPYKCGICGNQFRLAKFLKVHLISHSTDQLYQCNVCGECFKDTGSIKKHSRIHIAPPKLQICEICGKRYIDTHSFINHLITHDVPMTNSICQYCGKSYTESPCFMENSIGGMRVHRCKVCGKIYKDYFCLIKHVKAHETPIKCDKTDILLRAPYKVLTEEDSKTKGTGQSDIKSESDDHINTNQEEIAIPVIPKSAATVTIFSKSPVIQDEIASFEDRSDSYEKSHILSLLEIWLPCVTYGHSISPMSVQDISIKSEPLESLTTVLSKSPVIQDQTASFEDAPYKCDVCGKQFQTFRHLKKHKRIHSGKKSYIWNRCDKCYKWFLHFQTVKEHTHSQLGEKSTRCDMCTKQLRQSHSPDIQNKSTSTNNFKDKPTSINDHQDKSTSINNYQDKPTSINDYQDKPTRINDYQDKPTSINDYQDKPTSINDYQDKPTSRNDYKDKPTSINDYKDKPTSRNDYQDKPISINYYQDKPSSINEYEDNPPSINEPCSLKAPTGNHSEEKPYNCDMCGKQYKLAKYLEGHIISHSIDRLYQCNICGQCFKNPGSIKKHSCLHIAPSKVKICEFCGKRYRDTHSFINHMITHDVPMANSICQYCGKSYTESPCFMEHSLGGMRRVHGCKVCGKIYKDYLCLIKHVKVHGAPIKPWLFDLQLYESISGNNFAAGRKKNKSVFP